MVMAVLFFYKKVRFLQKNSDGYVCSSLKGFAYNRQLFFVGKIARKIRVYISSYIHNYVHFPQKPQMEYVEIVGYVHNLFTSYE